MVPLGDKPANMAFGVRLGRMHEGKCARRGAVKKTRRATSRYARGHIFMPLLEDEIQYPR